MSGPREDYLLRLVRQLLVMLAGSRAQREALGLEQALEDLDEAGRRALGLDGEVLVRLPAATLRALFTGPEGLDAGRAASAALLLRERARVLRAAGRAEEAERVDREGAALGQAALAAAPDEARAELSQALAAYAAPGPQVDR